MTSGSVFVACLRSVVEAASALGVDRDRLLRDADINPELMRMPTEIISVSRYLTLYRLAVERSGDPDFGLYVGHIMFVSSINLHLYMTAVCRSLREYFNMIPSTIRLRGDTGRVLVHPEGDFIRLEWHPLNDTIRRWRPLVDEMLKSSAEIVNAISALPVPVLGAELAYPAPDDTRGLKQAFGSNLRFGTEVSCLLFARESVRYPLVELDVGLRDDFWAGPRSVLREPEQADPFLVDVRAAIRRALPNGSPSVDDLAEDIGISRRTLQRRLSAQGASFKQILQGVREEQSRRYLEDPRLAITEIALLLGYSDQASFSNAFKSWCGCAPSEYRSRGGETAMEY